MAAVAMEMAKMQKKKIKSTKKIISGYSPNRNTPLFWYLGFHGNAILNFIDTPKASTHYGEYSYDVS
jgi:cellobiose-specific phosphotransferase system component IIC